MTVPPALRVAVTLAPPSCESIVVFPIENEGMDYLLTIYCNAGNDGHAGNAWPVSSIAARFFDCSAAEASEGSSDYERRQKNRSASLARRGGFGVSRLVRLAVVRPVVRVRVSRVESRHTLPIVR
eukprot:scaffold17663_cov54-Attheya_sp.AAC.1